MPKPTWDEYFLRIAETVSIRSDCERAKVGAVVVQGRRIVGTGYNDAPAGQAGCETCPRRLSGVKPDSPYSEGSGRCVAVHAEANALLYTDRSDLPGATLYSTRTPCRDCAKLVAAAGIVRVVTTDTLWESVVA